MRERGGEENKMVPLSGHVEQEVITLLVVVWELCRCRYGLALLRS